VQAYISIQKHCEVCNDIAGETLHFLLSPLCEKALSITIGDVSL